MKSECLSKEIWIEVAEHLAESAEPLANVLKQINYEGQGEQDKEEFLTHMQLACMAINYVAEFAADKCRIIPVKDRRGVGYKCQ